MNAKAVTVREAAQIAGCSESTIRYKIRTGKLTVIPSGIGPVMVRKSAVEGIKINRVGCRREA